MKKFDGLRWTVHMNDCLDFLAQHPDCPGDQVLAAQVHTQLLIDQLDSEGQSTAMPPYYQLSAMLLPVEAAKAQLPPGLGDNGTSCRLRFVFDSRFTNMISV